MRSFDPRRVGALECRVWVSYYRREWGSFLASAVRLVRHAFGFSWPRTLLGAWWVLRANQVWAPYPDNRPDLARHYMRRFYVLLARSSRERFDPEEAARLEVEWWRVHRDLQHGDDGIGAATVDASTVDASTVDASPVDASTVDASTVDAEPLAAALAGLYAATYGVPVGAVRLAARERAEAMRLSDAWVRAGADPAAPMVTEERAALVRSYAALLAAVHRAPWAGSPEDAAVPEDAAHPEVARVSP
jgi:hypothetical protein